MRRTICILTLLALALTTATIVVAKKPAAERPARKQGPGRHGPGGPGQMPLVPPGLVNQLELTADQQTAFDALAKQWAADRDAWLKENKPDSAQQAEMKAAREAGDRERMQALREQHQGKMKSLHEMRQSYVDKVKALLNDDQQSILARAQEHARQHRHHHHHHGGKGGKGGRPGKGAAPADTE